MQCVYEECQPAHDQKLFESGLSTVPGRELYAEPTPNGIEYPDSHPGSLLVEKAGDAIGVAFRELVADRVDIRSSL